MRAFIAVEISEEARGAVARLQDRLKEALADIGWVKPENLHLTLKFLGEIEESRVPALAEGLRSSLKMSPFSFTLEGTGAFPRMSSPRVLWVGINEGKSQLTELGAAVERTCVESGFPAEERPFSPHLTIGRVRSAKQLEKLVGQLQKTPFRAAEPTRADRVLLLQSTLGSGGPVYQVVREIPLESG